MNKKFTIYNPSTGSTMLTTSPLRTSLQFTKILLSEFESGQAFILATIVLFLILINTLVLMSGSLNVFQSSKYSTGALQATFLAEAGIDKAVASMNATGGTYNGEEEIALGQGVYSVSVTNIDASTKLIQSTGYVPDKQNPKSKRTVGIKVSKGEGVSFQYGVQIGEGGLDMSNNSRVNGSVYSNYNIVMNNGAIITGTAKVAGGTQPAADQQHDCISPSCADFIFGKKVSGNTQYDLSQSFKPVSTGVVNKVTLKLKKIGGPPNLTIRILGNNNNGTPSNESDDIPNKNDVKTSGTLNANLATTQYGFVEVAFSPNPTLNFDTSYWIVVDSCGTSTTACDNSANYWNWSQDILLSYPRGQAKWSPRWDAGSPNWSSIAGDLGFKVYMGGVVTSIVGANGASVSGDAYANTIASLTVGQHAYYQVQSNVIANSQNCNNGASTYCVAGSTDLAPVAMPISAENIQDWKDDALSGGNQTGVSGCLANLARGRYNGDVKLTNNCISTIESPIWITGDLELDNGAVLKLNSSYGPTSGVIVVRGKIKLSNNGQLRGSGEVDAQGKPISFLVGLSEYDSRVDNVVAIEADNGSDSSVLYAGDGRILLKNNATLTEVTGWKLSMDNGSSVTYQNGLAGLFFSSDPSGSFSVIKGTYQVK